ncbi:hypothetical protein PUN28_020182 [Cardiocondyla obscurior]
MCTSKARLDGKTVIITGASDGLGKETARDLYARGARVILACRNMEKTNEAVKDIKNNPPSWVEKNGNANNVGELAIYFLNLCSLKSVRDCAKNLLTNEAAIHILINNAGVALHPYEKTEDGIETTFQVNYLGHYLLTILLLPKMQASSINCRIINVSSFTYVVGDIDFDDIHLERSYQSYKYYASWKSYVQSKLANILFTKELASRLKEANIHGINVYAVHPGVINTEITRHGNSFVHTSYAILSQLCGKNLVQGAQTIIYCAIDEGISNETGLYYSNCNISNTYRKANNREYAKRLWNMSCRLLQLEPDENITAFLKTVSHQIL